MKWHELVNRANVVIAAVAAARFVPMGRRWVCGRWVAADTAVTVHRAHQCEYPPRVAATARVCGGSPSTHGPPALRNGQEGAPQCGLSMPSSCGAAVLALPCAHHGTAAANWNASHAYDMRGL